MALFTMTVGVKRFDAKTVDRVSKNFCRWRDRVVSGINTIGTHWYIRRGGQLCGEMTYDGRFWPRSCGTRRPFDIVDDTLAERFGPSNARSVEYRTGVRVALEWRLMRSPMGCPYPFGSVQADAFEAGLSEGLRISVGMDAPMRHVDSTSSPALTAGHEGRRKSVQA